MGYLQILGIILMFQKVLALGQNPKIVYIYVCVCMYSHLFSTSVMRKVMLKNI